jgi:single-strand DNA-binding protein
MADFNQVTLIGRLGKDAEIRTLPGGGEVASFSVATDTGYKDKQSGEWKKNTHWHQIVTFQEGIIKMLKSRGKKGARVFLQGQLENRSWRKDGETTDRIQAEIKIGPQDTFTFLDADKAEKQAAE